MDVGVECVLLDFGCPKAMDQMVIKGRLMTKRTCSTQNMR